MNIGTFPWKFSGNTTSTGVRIFTNAKGARLLESLLPASARVEPATPAPTVARQAVKADPLQTHPLWPEWAALSPSVKAACRNDFRVFLVVRDSGTLPSLITQIGKDIEVDAASEDRERARQDYEQHLSAARDPNQTEAIMAHRGESQLNFQNQIEIARESARYVRPERERGVSA
ncbi:MAG: hypothetical protein ABL983_03550 [Nitrospira sp.]